MKKCRKCSLTKPTNNFYKNKKVKDGLYSYCKSCHIKTYTGSRIKRTCNINSILYSRWALINVRVKNKKKIPCYDGVKLLMTKQQFYEKMKTKELDILFKNWIDSGKQNKLSPTVDRIDPKGHYETNNIRWLTWSDNARIGAKNNLNKDKEKAVRQYTKCGKLVKTFSSYTEASLSLLGHKNGVSNISYCAEGKIKSAYGFVWNKL